MARSGPTKTRTRPSGTHRARKKPLDDEGIIPILARAVREVESAAGRGKVTGQNRTKFQVAALLSRKQVVNIHFFYNILFISLYKDRHMFSSNNIHIIRKNIDRLYVIV